MLKAGSMRVTNLSITQRSPFQQRTTALSDSCESVVTFLVDKVDLG
jgi:hypothetical protein